MLPGSQAGASTSPDTETLVFPAWVPPAMLPPNDVMIALTTTASMPHAAKRRHQPAQSRVATVV